MEPVWLCILSGRQFEETFENTQWRKNQEVQPAWICLFWSKQLEETFEDTQWRKVKQMQPKWLCIFSGSQFEGPYEETQLQFGDNLNIFVNIWMYTISVCVWHKLFHWDITQIQIDLTLHSPRDHLKHKSYKNTMLVGVGNSDDWCTQNCPPQDCPPRGQFWGGQLWGSPAIEVVFNTKRAGKPLLAFWATFCMFLQDQSDGRHHCQWFIGPRAFLLSKKNVENVSIR